MEQLDKVIAIDQSPIGRTPRSNPATYTGLFDMIRKVFAATPEAKARGYKPRTVSPSTCAAAAAKPAPATAFCSIEMHFLADIYVPCEVCKGKRYNRETLEVLYKGKSIADVLDMTVEEALAFFSAYPRITRKLQTLYDVGLGYIRLGQSCHDALRRRGPARQAGDRAVRSASTGRTFYVLDEPTTGLHIADVRNVWCACCSSSSTAGNTVLIIEHNLDVIKACRLRHRPGPRGRQRRRHASSAQGTPEEICQCETSYTGQYLAPVLRKRAAESGDGRNRTVGACT